MLVLGRVHRSNDYEISVSLPGLLNGHVQAPDISANYTNLLHSLVQKSENHSPEFKSLPELYKRGNYVACYVKRTNAGIKQRIELSLEPELINQSVDPAKLKKGSKIVCTISSIEEHGYVVETGITILRGFLSEKDIDDDVKYYPGQQIFCVVKNMKTEENITTVKLSTKSKHMMSIEPCDNEPLDSFIPGIRFNLVIKKILSNGLQVSYNGNNVGYINQLYLSKPLMSYELGGNIIGTLLYILPTVKFAYFTELKNEPEDQKINSGEIISDAKVLYRQSNGIVLRLQKGIRGFVSLKRTAVDYDEIPLKFKPDSVHKCQVLTYDMFDRVYVCTMERKIMNEKSKLLVPESIKTGDLTTVKILRYKGESGFAVVCSGNTIGDVAPEHIADIGEKKPQVNAELKARVLGRNKEDNGWMFTLKKSLINCKLPILTDYNDTAVGSIYKGTIFRINSEVILVSFYNSIKGVIRAKNLDKLTGGIRNYTVGQVITVEIIKLNKDEGKIYLKIAKENDNKEFNVGMAVTGTIVESSLEGIYLRIDNENSDSVTGFLPAGHMAPCMELGSKLSVLLAPGDILSALVFATYPELLLTRTFVPHTHYRSIKMLKKGDCLPCSIKEIDNNGFKVIMPINNFESYGIVALNRTINTHWSIHQVVFGVITNIDRKKKKIHLAISLKDVWDCAEKNNTSMVASVDVLTMYLTKLNELSAYEYYKNKPFASAQLGQCMTGVVIKVTEYGLVLKLDNGITGTARAVHYKGKFDVGDEVNAKILWINYIHELVEVTLLPSLINSIKNKTNQYTQFAADIYYRAEIVLVTNWFVLAVLKGQGKGSLVALPVRSHANDLDPILYRYEVEKRLRCYVVLNRQESQIVPICLLKSAFETFKKKILIAKQEMDNSTIVQDCEEPTDEGIKRKYEETDSEHESIEEEDAKDIKPRHKKKKRTDKVEIAEMEVEEPEEEEEEVIIEINKQPINDVPANTGIKECGFFWDTKPDMLLSVKEETSSDSEDEKEDQSKAKKNKKKLNATERRELERQKEREIREREEFLAGNQTPNSVDQFDRMVLASPNSSLIWLQYMAFHLQATEIDKARAVAKRALKTINFREENERLNVWQAWLNLESRFGTPDTLNSVYYEAINANDPMKIYLHMLTVHADANRQADLEKTVKTITGKFKQIPEAWIGAGTALLKMGLKEKSRFTMQRAIQCLPATERTYMI